MPPEVVAYTLQLYTVAALNPCKVYVPAAVYVSGKLIRTSSGRQVRVYDVMTPLCVPTGGGLQENCTLFGSEAEMTKLAGGLLGPSEAKREVNHNNIRR